MFEHLFSPLHLGGTRLPNRICFLAHRTHFGRRGLLNDRHIAYYRRRAEGGCGLIIVGELSIQAEDRPWESMVEAYHDQVREDYRRLTRAVHEWGTPVFAQLCHHGFQSSGAISRQAILGPSAMADIVFGETSKPMEPEDMEEVIRAFSRAAVLTREGDFDGIEIDMGPESLLRQFLSPISNHREDAYGGSLENKMRLPLEVLEGVRRAVGSDFTVGVRLCADEKFWDGITIDQSREFAKTFEARGQTDFFNVAVGTYYNLHLVLASMHLPSGFAVDLAKQLKESVSLPVIASHQIDSPEMAEKLLEEGRIDAVGLVRNLICDPDAPRKVRERRTADIRYCVRDNVGCIGRVNQGKALSCIQNPEVGFESARQGGSPAKIGRNKRVMVVGAGPGGLEAARAARETGHEVTVYERDDTIGGQINLIVRQPGRAGMGEIIWYLRESIRKLGVRVITGVEVTPEWVLEQEPDRVIVATGSRPANRPVPGIYGSPAVLNVRDILEGLFPVGERVLMVDENGGHHAAATAEFLADQGKKVDIVTSELFIGIDLAPIGDLFMTRQRLLQKGVTFTCDVMIEEIQGNRVMGRDVYTREKRLFEGYETIVLDMENHADDDLYKQLKGRIREVYRIGDCVAPRGIDMAILEGRRVGELA